MKRHVRITALLLIIAVVFAAVAGCSEPAETDENDTQTAAPATDAAGETVETERKYSDEIAAYDYGGYDFHMATNGLSEEYFSALDFAEMTGEPLNDAVYERNRRIEQKFNITLSCENSSAANMLKLSVQSGTHDVDFVYVLADEVFGLISGGFLLPINDLEGIDMTKPYWDQIPQQQLSINGKLFQGYLDISFDHYESIATLFYSGQLINDYSLDDPYNLYMDNGWTMEKMYSMMQTVSKDLNGDSKFTVADDQLGFVGREFEYLPVLYSSDEALVEITQEGGEYNFKLNLAEERLMQIGDLVNKMLNDKTLSVLARDDATRTMFKEGRALFYSRLLGDFRNLRDKEDDYGIISYPALDYSSGNSYVYVQNPFTILAPIDTEDRLFLGTIIEALAADTYDYVLDVYFEKAVIGKGMRDQKSVEILRDMITRRTYDLSYAFGLDIALSAYGSALKSGNYASVAGKYSASFKKTADKNIAAILEAMDY